MDRQPHTFQEELEQMLGIKLRLKINDNRSTMLSVKWDPDAPKVSLHRMFLKAPKNIMEALACYIGSKDTSMDPKMKAYIDDNLKGLDYSYQLDLRKLQTAGKNYDLKELYDDINHNYFDNELKLAITWFGQPKVVTGSKMTCGLYSDPLKLIKIHRILDHSRCPEYFVAFVIYHEMLHYCCPSHVDTKGTRHIHSKEFKKREKEFRDFERAQKWLKRHQEELFGGFVYGRT